LNFFIYDILQIHGSGSFFRKIHHFNARNLKENCEKVFPGTFVAKKFPESQLSVKILKFINIYISTRYTKIKLKSMKCDTIAV
jgi:hypothetical protein